MKNEAYDPSGHIKLSVTDIDKSKAFYSALFKTLGFKRVAYGELKAGWVTNGGFGISIVQAKILRPKHKFTAPGFHHLCLKARSTKVVDSVYKLIKAKTHAYDAPQKYPEYSKKYYAVFFADPDGMKLEVAYY